MKSTFALLAATTALSVTLSLAAHGAAPALADPDGGRVASGTVPAPHAVPVVLADNGSGGAESDDDDDDDDDDDRQDDADDGDCEDDDGDCPGARAPAPAGTATPPANGLFGTGAAPKAVVK